MTVEAPWDDGTRGKEALLGDMEAILEPDIADPGRRRFIAMLLDVHIRHAIGRSMDDCLGRWIDGEGDGPSPEEAVEAMRTAVKRVRGYDPDDPRTGGASSRHGTPEGTIRSDYFFGRALNVP